MGQLYKREIERKVRADLREVVTIQERRVTGLNTLSGTVNTGASIRIVL